MDVGPGPREAEVRRCTGPSRSAAAAGRASSATRSSEGRRPAQFKEVSDALGVENYWPWGPSVGDLNADGFDDVFITAGMNYPYRYGQFADLNDRGQRFLDAEFLLGVEPRRGGVAHALVRARLRPARTRTIPTRPGRDRTRHRLGRARHRARRRSSTSTATATSTSSPTTSTPRRWC